MGAVKVARGSTDRTLGDPILGDLVPDTANLHRLASYQRRQGVSSQGTDSSHLRSCRLPPGCEWSAGAGFPSR